MLPREVIAVHAGAFLLRAAACIHVFFFFFLRDASALQAIIVL